MGTSILKCPNCGAIILFSPKTGGYFCEHCSSNFTSEEIVGYEKSISDKEIDHDFNSHTNVFICESCAAEVISDENTAATFCVYCGSPLALKGRISGELRPDYIIPFEINRETAINSFISWRKRKWFVPTAFKKVSHLDKITGLYAPYWVLDCFLDATLGINGEEVVDEGNNYRVKVYSHESKAVVKCDKVLADASLKLDDTLMNALEPFDYSKMVEFNRSYLLGFYADRYDVPKDIIYDRIKSRAENGAFKVMSDSLPRYRNKKVTKKESDIIRENWSYAFFPVWIINFTYKKKKVEFLINGQTGRIIGELPISTPKLVSFTVLASLLFSIVGGPLLVFLLKLIIFILTT